MAIFFLKKYPLFIIFMLRICFNIFVFNFRNAWLKSVIICVNHVTFYILPPPYLLELMIIARKKYAGKLAYILLYDKTKLFTRQIGRLISRFFVCPNIPNFLWTVYLPIIDIICICCSIHFKHTTFLCEKGGRNVFY